MVQITIKQIANLGVNNGAAGVGAGGVHTKDQLNELFMKQFSGEVLKAYSKKCLFKDLQRTRFIKNGKSASFAYTGTMNARYHDRGMAILGSNNPPVSEQVIYVDDLLISDFVLDDLDRLKLHFDVLQEYAAKCGNAMAVAFDDRCARLAVLAARTGSMNADQPGGTRLKHALAATDGEVLAEMIFMADQVFSEKDVPEWDRHIAVRPAQYHLLVAVENLINRDFGGTGSYVDNQLGSISGMTLHKTNRLPSKNITTRLSGENNDYTGDFRDTVAVVLNKEAIGSVQLRGLRTQRSGSEFNMMYQAQAMVVSYATGHGILRSECAIELSSASSSATDSDHASEVENA